MKFVSVPVYVYGDMSLPVRGAWIEIAHLHKQVTVSWSLPVRGAWIEISFCGSKTTNLNVAPRKGSVD